MTGSGDAGIAKASRTWSRKTVLAAKEPRYTTQGWFLRYLEDDQKTSLGKNLPAYCRPCVVDKDEDEDVLLLSCWGRSSYPNGGLLGVHCSSIKNPAGGGLIS